MPRVRTSHRRETLNAHVMRVSLVPFATDSIHATPVHARGLVFARIWPITGIYAIATMDIPENNANIRTNAWKTRAKTTGHVILKMILSTATARTTSMENDVPSITFVRRENCVEMAPTVIYWMLRLARLRSTGVRRTSPTGTNVGVLMDTQVRYIHCK